MTVRELLENAHLDALGLLDEDERVAFEKAFRAAPQAIRAQIRDEQSRWARMESCLPRLEPGADLRERVLAAIRSEIELEVPSDALVSYEASELGEDDAITGEVESSRRRLVPAFWQGAAVAMFCASIVLGGAFISLLRVYNDIDRESRGTRSMEAALTLLKSGEHMHDMFLDPNSSRVAFTGQNVATSAMLWTNPAWKGTGVLITSGLEATAGTTYRVVAISEEGKEFRTLVEGMNPTGSMQRFQMDMTDLPSGTTLALVPVVNGQQGAPIMTCTLRNA